MNEDWGSVKSVKGFDGANCFDTAVRAIQLAEKLGLKVVTKSGGSHWTHIQVPGVSETEVISFWDPSHAYAYILGIQLGMKSTKG